MTEEYRAMAINENNIIEVRRVYDVVESIGELDEDFLHRYLGSPVIHHHQGLFESGKRYSGEMVLGILNKGSPENYLYIEGLYLYGAEEHESSSLKPHNIMGAEYKVRLSHYEDVVPSLDAAFYVFDSNEEGRRTMKIILDDLDSVCIKQIYKTTNFKN